MQKKLGNLVPKDQLPDYAEKTLEAKSTSGDKKKEAIAAGELYSLIVT